MLKGMRKTWWIKKFLAPQGSIDFLVENMTNEEFRSAFQVLAQAVMVKANRVVVAPMNSNMGTMASRVRDFTRMNRPEFYGLMMEEDPQEFIDEVYKVLDIMRVTLVEKGELAAYQLKGVSQVWFNQRKEARTV